MKKNVLIPFWKNEMTKDDLIENLNRLGVKESEYSLNGDFNPDTIVLWHNYYKWEIYYIDERGEKALLKTLYNEQNAYYEFYKLFEKAKS